MKRVFVLFFIPFFAIAFQCSKPATQDYASVSFFVGDVLNNGASIAIGDPINEKDIITTGGGSSCDIKVGESIIRVKEKSKMAFSMIGIKDKVENTTLDLSEGKMLCKPKKLLKDDTFMIKTPTAVAAVRGTEFTVETDANKTTRIKVYDGKVQIAKRMKQLENNIPQVMNASSSVETQESAVITQQEVVAAEKIVDKAIAENKGADISAVIAKVQTEVAVSDDAIRQFKIEDFKKESNELISVAPKEPEEVNKIKEAIAIKQPIPQGRLLITKYEIYFIKNGRVEWEGKIVDQPVRSNGKIYIASEDYVFCANSDGPVVWKKELINDGKIELKENTATIFINGKAKTLDATNGADKL